MKNTLIKLNHVSKHYEEGSDNREILTDINAEIKTTEVVSFIGKSGIGKSTLLNLISGIDVCDSGDITIDGVFINKLSDTKRTLFRRKNIGFVFQFFNLVSTLTIEENIALPLKLNKFDPETTNQTVDRLLEHVGLLDRKKSFPDKLSGGEQQRIAVARALSHNPKLIIADEPTGNLNTNNPNNNIELYLTDNNLSGIIPQSICNLFENSNSNISGCISGGNPNLINNCP